MDDRDLTHLRRCIELAREALDVGNEPFGSVLVSSSGDVLREERNQVVTGADETLHPEFLLARWAAAHLTADERAGASVYTSGEHCPMCSAAHAWVGLGRIVYVASAAQLTSWLSDWGVGPSRVRPLPAGDVAPNVRVEGPANELVDEMRALHERFHGR